MHVCSLGWVSFGGADRAGFGSVPGTAATICAGIAWRRRRRRGELGRKYLGAVTANNDRTDFIMVAWGRRAGQNDKQSIRQVSVTDETRMLPAGGDAAKLTSGQQEDYPTGCDVVNQTEQ